MEEQGDWLGKLQSLDRSTKKKILIAGTVVVMAGVLYVWTAYFNNIVLSPAATGSDDGMTAPVSQSVQTQGGTASSGAPDAGMSQGLGFFARIGNGFAVMGRAIVSLLASSAAPFRSPGQYAIPSH